MSVTEYVGSVPMSTDPGDLLRTGWSQIQHTASGRPALVLLGLVVVAAMLQRARVAIGRSRPRDPVRTFPRQLKQEILARAGGRCEQHTLLHGRCPETARLEADHVHPHSRGGWTVLDNGQALCRRHNKAKNARVPSAGELRRLARRRGAYFPAGTATTVSRRRPQRTG